MPSPFGTYDAEQSAKKSGGLLSPYQQPVHFGSKRLSVNSGSASQLDTSSLQQFKRFRSARSLAQLSDGPGAADNNDKLDAKLAKFVQNSQSSFVFAPPVRQAHKLRLK